MRHPRTRDERRAAARRCHHRRSRRIRFNRRVNALLTHYRNRDFSKLNKGESKS